MSLSAIYAYYEDGVSIEGDEFNRSYVCKLCKAKGAKKIIKASTTSNLISHLKTEAHYNEYLIYEAKQKAVITSPHRANKRLRFDSPNANSLRVDSQIINSITQSPKYKCNSMKQRERCHFVLMHID